MLTRLPGFAMAIILPCPTPRIPLTLNSPKGFWSQNQLASFSPTPGKPLTILHTWSLPLGLGSSPDLSRDPHLPLLSLGSLPQGPVQVSPGEMEESGQEHTGE